MITLLSPSKSMDMDAANHADSTQPDFLDHSEKLIRKLRTFSTKELMEFMAISEKLAVLNRHRFKEWKQPFTPENAKPALFAFTGDVYDGLEAEALTAAQTRFAQKHLRILSGLYGLLRPLDLIQPYRLEMGRPLALDTTPHLYAFWRTTLTQTLNELPGNLLVNLASQEYFKAVDPRQLDKEIIHPVFKDEKNGRFKIISFYAKKARGMMARYIITNQITHPENLHGFTDGGYAYNTELSTPSKPLFTRAANAK